MIRFLIALSNGNVLGRWGRVRARCRVSLEALHRFVAGCAAVQISRKISEPVLIFDVVVTHSLLVAKHNVTTLWGRAVRKNRHNSYTKTQLLDPPPVAVCPHQSLQHLPSGGTPVNR